MKLAIIFTKRFWPALLLVAFAAFLAGYLTSGCAELEDPLDNPNLDPEAVEDLSKAMTSEALRGAQIGSEGRFSVAPYHGRNCKARKQPPTSSSPRDTLLKFENNAGYAVTLDMVCSSGMVESWGFNPYSPPSAGQLPSGIELRSCDICSFTAANHDFFVDDILVEIAPLRSNEFYRLQNADGILILEKISE